jgi:glycosyltransferase involved in cell wall biosynthesis
LPNAIAIHQYAIKRRLRTSDKLVVGIAAMYPFSYLKGGDVLRSVIKIANVERMSIRFAFLQDFPQTEQGKTDFWASIDVLLHLSRADNRPNVIEEAHVNGVPVYASNVGGVQESLIEGIDYPLNSLDAMHILDNLVKKKWVRFDHMSSQEQNRRIFEQLLDLYSEFT